MDEAPKQSWSEMPKWIYTAEHPRPFGEWHIVPPDPRKRAAEYVRADIVADLVAALEHAKLNMPHPDQMIDGALARAKGEIP